MSNASAQNRVQPLNPRRMWPAWLPLLVLPVVAVGTTSLNWPAWGVMWSLALAIYCGCKWLTWRCAAQQDAPLWRQAGYLLAWPGLDAAAFLNPRLIPARPALREGLFAGCKLAGGVVLLYGVARQVPSEHLCAIGWVGMVGLVMVLHFGLFHLLSCAWRRAGVEARPLMNWPLASVSLSEFWGRRWNTAFRDLTHRFLFRPLTARLGGRNALVAGFLFSGLVHDVVISFPAGGGYGGPTLYFLLQGAGMIVERTRPAQACGLGAGARGWLFTMALLLVPAPLLFHEPFVTRVIVPFMHAVGAL